MSRRSRASTSGRSPRGSRSNVAGAAGPARASTLIAGGPLEPHLRGHRRRGQPLRAAPPAARPRAGHRPRHGPRAQDHLRPRPHRRPGRPRPRALHRRAVNGAPFYVMDFVDGLILRDAAVAERSPPRPARNAGHSIADDPGQDPRRRPRRRRPRRPRQEGGLHRPPAQALVRAVGEVEDRASCPSSTRSTTPCSPASPSRARPRSSTATTGSTTA